MSRIFFDQPILNSPYEPPSRHHALDAEGQPLDLPPVEGRRRSELITPVPKARKKQRKSEQASFVLPDAHNLSTANQEYNPTPIINEIRNYVANWRTIPNPADWGVTPATQRLLTHWRHHQFQGVRPFFCQVEAVETAIWLTEVARRDRRHDKFRKHLQGANEQSNPELFRIALKMATGSGKTTVMAMLIAWQAVNAVRTPGSNLFSRGFLVVTPGITIRDRLRVLKVNDPDNYYRGRELIPTDMLPDIERIKIVITNYHAFKLRETLEISKTGRSLLQGRDARPNTLESEGQMLARVASELLGFAGKNGGLVVLNDEAHHCYREKPDSDEDVGADEREEAKKNSEAARLWIAGLEAVKRRIGIAALFDLSATPFFLRGSGYREGTLFPWTVSDFSLMDAIECGIVKLPRVPVSDNLPSGEVPIYRNLWDHIGKEMPKQGRAKGGKGNPLTLPNKLQTALYALYGHYEKTFEEWSRAGIAVPPVFIVVCNNTSTSELVYEWISGFERDGEDEQNRFIDGHLKLFRNYDEHGARLSRPNTLLIDSEQVDSGETLDPAFRAAVAPEIEQFRREKMQREGAGAGADAIPDADLLREVMNTVGRKGRLAEREGLRGKVQCIYFDPPYGIKFNSNWQVSTVSRDVKDGKREDVSREPEQVKAFRDTWKDGIHSYLTYLRDRITVAWELLTDSGSIFVQISDENVHRVRSVLDEIFGPENFISQIVFTKTAGATSEFLPGTYDTLLMYARCKERAKFRPPFKPKNLAAEGGSAYNRVRRSDKTWRVLSKEEKNGAVPLPPDARVYRIDNLTSQSVGREKGEGAASWFPVDLNGKKFLPSMKARWKTSEAGMRRLKMAGRLEATTDGLYYVRFFDDFQVFAESDIWTDTGIAGFASDKKYVVETSTKVVQRCLLMVTDPGDLVLDPTYGSGTTAIVAEQWGRRWITIDTSRVALALARMRLMSAKYPYYLLADSREGRAKEQNVSGKVAPDTSVHNDVRQGFVYERAPHVTLKSIANNAEIDVLWEEAQQTLEPLRARLNAALATSWEEWQIPREADPAWPASVRNDHAAWWAARIERQRRIDASIAHKADIEYLYDRPYEDRARVRVAGPFTVESLSPHRVVPADEDELLDLPSRLGQRPAASAPPLDFAAMVLEHLRTAGVHQSRKADSIHFTSLTPWPGTYIGAEGRFLEGEMERRAGILIGPEFGTLARADIVAAAREASEARFDVLIACAFNYDAHASDLTKLGPLPILKARMNPDLHMADDLKNTGKGNLFVVFGEPDLVVESVPGEPDHVRIRIRGVDVFDPQTGDIRSGDTKSIAAWFIDTDYNEESFYVRHAYFLGANDPYKSLKTALRAEIDEAAWATLYRDVSRPFRRPETGRIAVKVINHFGDEVMKLFSV